VSRSADLRVLKDAVGEAAAEIMARRRRGIEVERKQDGSPVTAADFAADDILRTRLMVHAPDYGWLSEESRREPAAAGEPRVWVVDPIDGTRAYADGRDEFTVAAALVEDGRAVLSVVAAPARGETYFAEAGAGARRDGERLFAEDALVLEDARVFGASGMFAHPGWPTPWPRLRVSNPNSTNLRAALAAAGEADAVLALWPKADWDAAPGGLIASEAGLRVTDHKGRPHAYAGETPEQAALLVAPPGLQRDLLERLRHLPENLRDLVRR